jgi:hypothetical protein
MPILNNYFGFWFPNHGSFTAHWIPTIGPQAGSAPGGGGGSGQAGIKNVDGIVSVLLADNKTFQKFQQFDPYDVYQLVFADLLEIDRTNFVAFKRAVSGAIFEMLDPITGSYIEVTFMPDSETSVFWSLDYPQDERWSASMDLFVVGAPEIS